MGDLLEKKLQITKKMAHELHELTRISEKRETSISTTKGGHGLHRFYQVANHDHL